jgi:microcompartment protein CcmL/EutN
MPVALGFLETNSLIGAVEASNVMAKTSNIILLGKEVLSQASITIKIVGEKDSVEAAINVGTEAVRNLELNVSSHIIIEPDEQIISVLPEISGLYFSLKRNTKKKIKKPAEKLKVEAEKIPAAKLEPEIIEPEKPEPEKIKNKKSKIKKPKVEKTKLKSEKIIANRKTVEEKIPEIKERKRPGYINDTIERLRQEALGLNKSKKKKPIKKEIKKKREGKNINKDENNNLKSMNVHQLRKLARDTKNFPILGREISKAKREILLDYFNNLK